MLKASESLIVEIDISENDEACLTVLQKHGKDNLWVLNSLTGDSATDLYFKLIGKECKNHSEIIFCKDCERFRDGHKNNMGYCTRYRAPMYFYDFCSRAKKYEKYPELNTMKNNVENGNSLAMPIKAVDKDLTKMIEPIVTIENTEEFLDAFRKHFGYEYGG